MGGFEHRAQRGVDGEQFRVEDFGDRLTKAGGLFEAALHQRYFDRCPWRGLLAWKDAMRFGVGKKPLKVNKESHLNRAESARAVQARLDAPTAALQDVERSGAHPAETWVDKFPSRERSASAISAPRVSAIFVAGRSDGKDARLLELCLRSALAEPWIDDVVVVNHRAPAAVASALRALQADRRDVRLIDAAGAATAVAAANLGAAHAHGRWLLFLDGRVVLRRGAVARMAAAGGEAQAPWIVGGRLSDTRGRERQAARTGALNAWSAVAVALQWSGPKRRKRRDEPAKVAAVSAAFMLIPRSDFQNLGGFDEAFVTDAADLDLCRRAVDAGGNVLVQPSATGVQFEGARLKGRKQAQGLALFAARCAKTPLQKAFALVAGPALGVLVALREFVAGHPPLRR